MTERDPLLVEREKTHGSFNRNAELYGRLCKAITEDKIPENRNDRQVLATDMILVKLSRILSGDPMNKDHWNDIAGYARLGAEACE